MNEELNLEKLADLAVHYPEYLIDAAAEHFNGDECKLEAIAVVVSGLNDLYMPSTALLFLRAVSYTHLSKKSKRLTALQTCVRMRMLSAS